MNLKHRIKKLAGKVFALSQFCNCSGVSYFSIDWKSGDFINTKVCGKCGRSVKPLTIAEWSKATYQSDEPKSLINPDWKNYTDEG